MDVGMMGEHYPNKEFQPMVMCDRKVVWKGRAILLWSRYDSG